MLQVLRSGVPSEVMLFEPAASENGLYVLGTYMQDNWKVDNPADAEPWPAVRLLPQLPARADARRVLLHDDEHRVPGGRQPEHVEPAGAARRRHLRAHRRRQDGPEGQLRQVLVEPGRAAFRRTTTRTRRSGTAATSGTTSTATRCISRVRKAG